VEGTGRHPALDGFFTDGAYPPDVKSRRLRFALALGCAAALAAAAGAAAVQTPGRTIVRGGPVGPIALNHASLAFVVGRSKADCDHVELWNTDTKGTWRFGRPGPCTNLGSTGAAVTAVAVSQNRVVWIRYNGGNLRDWQLMTATTTRKTPRQLRFVEQDVDLPSPFAVGDATHGMGIPYAAGRDVVLLGANGAATFVHTAPSRVLAVTGGRGPEGAVVAALLETGEIELLRNDGSVARTVAFPAGDVRAIALAPAGLVVQLPGGIEIRKGNRTTSVTMPAGAVMTDYAEGRILYSARNGDVRARKVAGGQDTLLLKGGSGARALTATLDTHGLAWARGTSLSFACAVCVTYGS
jgi:hypothetical protein